MQILPINNSTAFKANLPQKTDTGKLTDIGYHDYWDTLANACEKEGHSETLQKHLNELQNIEKDKIVAFDILNYMEEGPREYKRNYYFGLFDSQKSLEKARTCPLAWHGNAIESFVVSPEEYGHTFFHNGHRIETCDTRKLDSKFFLDILDNFIEKIKINSKGNTLINKLRVK